ncbi:alpha/beta fold hydrolase [Nocardia puris]|uniref:Lipase (Class 2) n=1 Tax=Nocardia puris TaxID=208602 RepID=A0A366E3L6_9NOCA|nr:alpha/beta fold hydrolase [Nocardia puris]MBF6214755.1 alpha/beta fold hydrolase [Nocardia puris]MBF6368771.1 alpha/beta fold hydrolase [Nocardia puris]MBF6462351.1 alpha/beta fold hydrolase [Nocardia puris]RBO96933.1 lipase (class 2) [Nocardia puris]
MKRSISRRPWAGLFSAAVMAGVAVLAVSLTGVTANASPEAPTEQDLAQYIAEGRKAGPVADSGSGAGSSCDSGSGTGSGNGSGDCYAGSGSSSGSSGGYASDTIGHGPQMTSWLAAFGYGLANPDAAPPGANDWNCKPTAENPRPVVMLHGTWMNAYNGYAFMGQPIKDAGFCTFTFNYGRSNLLEGGGLGSVLPGVMGTGYIWDSAKQLATFVDRVLAATGASEVDIIAHSQGGSMANWYTKFEGGADKVKNLITYGATHHGTTLIGIGALGRAINNLGIDILGFIEIFVGHAGIQQTVGSEFVQKLNANGDTIPGVDYTVVGTRYDEITTPYDSTFLQAGPGVKVDNITLQEGCEQDLSDHLTILYSPRALSIALRALDPVRFPNLNCTFNPWLIGGGGSL